MAVAAVLLIGEANSEPYHIDGLRQASFQNVPLDEVMARSFEVEQPPLDMVINASVQRAVGHRDSVNGLSVLLGIESEGLEFLPGREAGFGLTGSFPRATVTAASPITSALRPIPTCTRLRRS